MGIIREMTGQRRYRVYNYTAVVDIMNRGIGFETNF
jgi:hypothetical protein